MKKSLGAEFEKIEQMTRHLPTASSSVLVGIGDDAAVLRPPTNQMLFCTDLMLESVHFRTEWASPQDIGMKALVRTLSDIAAMNGRPLYATVSLALPDSVQDTFHIELYKGLARAAAEYKVEIIGGDLSRSPSQIFLDVAVVGESARPYKRSGAKPGDLLIVSGELGGSQAGLHMLEQGLKEDSRWALLKRLHLLPQPRFDALKKLNIEGLVTSMIDISDSLSSVVRHLGHHSNVGFQILEEALPIHPAALEYAERFNLNPSDLALHGGEDYQLLFTADAEVWEVAISSHPETFDSSFHVIGVATPPDEDIILVDKKNNHTPLQIQGWDHFKKL